MRQRHVPMTLCVWLSALALAIASCGNGDGAPSPRRGTATSTIAANPATASVAESLPTGTGAASATVSGEASATAAQPLPTATEPSRPNTATPDRDASPTATPQSFSDDEQALLDTLLTAGDLEGDWDQLREEAPEVSAEPGICGAPPFPDEDQKLAEVEREFQSGDGSAFVLENLVEYPEDVAADAMDYLRDSLTCDQFSDPSGMTLHLEEADDPNLGDEDFAIRVSLDVAGSGTLEGQFIYVRLAGLIATVTYLELDGDDPEQAADIAELAIGKIAAAMGDTIGLTAAEQASLDALLSEDDLPSGWSVLTEPGMADPDEWTPLCEEDPFARLDDAIARVSVDFREGRQKDDATVQQVLAAYPDNLADDAMAYERETAGCAEWTENRVTVTIEPVEFPELGEDLLAVHFSYARGSDDPFEGNWIVVQVNNLVSTIVYFDPDGADPEFAEELVRAAVDRMEAVDARED